MKGFNLIKLYLNLLKVFFMINFCMVFIFTSFAQNGVIISGPTEVCPNNTSPIPGGPSGHHYSAEFRQFGSVVNCFMWQWWVIDDGFAIAGGNGNSFNYNFLDVGQYTVQFTGSGCSIFGTVTGTINVNSSVKMPNPITGPNLICSPGQTLSFESYPGLDMSDPACVYHYEYYWTAPAGWSINGGGDTFFGHGNTAEITPPANTPNGTYNISIQATIPKPQSTAPPPNNSFLSDPRNYSITIGPFNSSVVQVQGAVQICNGNAYTYTANVPQGHQSNYSYSWTYPSGWIVQNTSQNTIRLFVPSNNNSYGPVRVSVNNGCGPSQLTGITTFPGMNCNFMMAENFKIYPNPSDGELNVEYDWSDVIKSDIEFKDLKAENLPEFLIEIFDIDQKIVKEEISKSGKIRMETYNFKPGTYFLHIHFGNEILRKQIKIN
ncbi:T9SS type A sorting domain-containing protein [Cecembia calidifontis]|uniref:Putative secreted protein (Por secretion system target) n=2 Tax=Cecembia TaxID=1187078 RepID=A0A2P8E614_9BACT|nr:T9SS type A sorting domain-containing protein [Cecembia calidifontis]PSL04878.1 putative secreted protein (Por secretion system target) [Cecembia rubra]